MPSDRRLISLLVPVGLAVVAAGSTAAASRESPRTVSGSEAVIVVSSGWGQVSEGGSGFYSWGAVLANQSTTEDAVGVTVTVSLYAGGVGYDRRQIAIATVPAGRRFYVGDGEATAAGGRITRMQVAIQVKAMRPKLYLLPSVSRIRFDRFNDGVSAEITNPYSAALNLYNAEGFLVAFGRSGRIVGGTSIQLANPVSGQTSLAPGAHLRVEFPLIAVSIKRLARAGISINPA
jgi:hypothetical protein